MSYQETIRPPWWVYAGVIAMVALFCFTFAAVITVPPAVVLFVVLSALFAWIIERRRLVLAVDDQTFHVGEVDIARTSILDAVALDAQGLREVAGPDSDGRARMVLRNLATKEGIKVDVTTQAHPYWLISSKRPRELAACLNSAAG